MLLLLRMAGYFTLMGMVYIVALVVNHWRCEE